MAFERRLRAWHDAAGAIEGLSRDIPVLLEGLTSDQKQHMVDVEVLDEAVAIARYLLSDADVRRHYEEASGPPEKKRTDFWISPAALRAIYQDAERIRTALTSDPAAVNQHAYHLVRMLGHTFRQMGSAYLIKLTQVSQDGLRRARDLAMLLHTRTEARELSSEMRDVVESARDTGASIQETAAAAQEAAGITADSKMAKHFVDLADKEGKAADRFRKWTIWLMSGGGLAAVVLLFFLPASGDGNGYFTHEFAQRVVVTAAAFTIAGYLARQAHLHRTTANWAGSLAVQLMTFDAFLKSIPGDVEKEQLRVAFAARVFGEPTSPKGDSKESGSLPLPLEKMVNLIPRADKAPS